MLTSLLNIIPPLHDPKSAKLPTDDTAPIPATTTTDATQPQQPQQPESRKIHIALIECDAPVPAVFSKYGTYGQIFATLLTAAAERVSAADGTRIVLETSRWDAVKGEFPSDEVMKECDCVLVSGSSKSAYDDLPWIRRLQEFIQDIYLNRPHTKLIGSCFGHQIICQSLFPLVSRTHASPIVVNNPRGWTVGLHPVTVPENAPFTHLFFPSSESSSSSPLTTLNLQFVHHDHVRPPVPAPFTNLGATPTCDVQGIYEKGRVLTTQGHAEFDSEINAETLKAFAKIGGWAEEEIVKGLEMVQRGEKGLGEGDAGRVADGMVRLCLE